MKIPESINLDDQEVLSFLNELADIAIKTRASGKRIIKHWEKLQEMKKKNPNNWHINK